MTSIFLLAAVVACVAWTVTKEEIFREFREWVTEYKTHERLFVRKLSYMLTCEYCFSHWVTFFVVAITGARLVYNSVLGQVVAVFTIVAIANVYMTLYFILRQTLKFVGGLAKRHS